LSGAIGGAVGKLALSIEHVGSTAVPGLEAKPIIDLDVVIASDAQLPAAIQALASLGYVHQGDLGYRGERRSLAKAAMCPAARRAGPGRNTTCTFAPKAAGNSEGIWRFEIPSGTIPRMRRPTEH